MWQLVRAPEDTVLELPELLDIRAGGRLYWIDIDTAGQRRSEAFRYYLRRRVITLRPEITPGGRWDHCQLEGERLVIFSRPSKDDVEEAPTVRLEFVKVATPRH